MKLNVKLLKKLYLLDHESKEEHDMTSFIINYCYKIPHISISIDKEKNLFITKNTTNPETYACIIAHQDTVQSFVSNRTIYISNGVATAHYLSNGAQCGLNADDCNGILVALQMLEVMPNLKVCFTTQEEIGGIGASEACNNYDFFFNVCYMLQADRHGNSDLIVNTNGIDIVTDEFLTAIKPYTDAYEYTPAYGTFTDIGILCKDLGICGVNLSCGYYSEHTLRECCVLHELEICLNLVHDIIEGLDGNDDYYFIQHPIKPISTISKFTQIPCDTCKSLDCMNCTKLPC